MRHASFFSGVGGLDLGFERAGITTVSVSEIDPYACAVLAERFPDAPNLGSITEVQAHDIPEADIWSGGFPCQDLSVAGKRAGFAGKRSSLAFTFLDLVEQRRPRWIVLENVPGLFSSNNGADFGRLLYEMEQLGYGVSWRTLDARYFGVAQRRRRVFIVGSLESDRAAEVLFECEGGCGHLEASRPAGEGAPAGSGGGVEVSRALRASLGKRGERGDRGDELIIGTIGAGLAKRTGTTQDPHLVGWGDRTFGADISNTIPARYHKGINTTVEPGHLVGSEAHADGVRAADGLARRLDNQQGVDTVPAYGENYADTLAARDWKRGVANQDIGRRGFLGIVRQVSFGDYQNSEHSASLSTMSGNATSTSANLVVGYQTRVDEKNGNFSLNEAEVANSLSALWPSDTSHRSMTLVAPSESILSFPSRFGSNANVTEGQAQSMAHSAGAPAVFRKSARAQTDQDSETWVEGDVANTLNSFDVGDIRTTHAIVGGTDQEDPLLPLGLDSHRYRCCGNGVVAPVAEWIGRRIVEVDRRWREEGK